jgi:uncharacterized RDD family membrane protein YckC
MNISNNSEPQVPSGYLSEKSKRKYTIAVGVFGAVFFLINILSPVIVMLIAVPSLIFTGDAFKKIDIESVVYWKDSIWFIEQDTRRYKYALKKIMLREPKSINTVCELSLGHTNLLAGDDGIWIISPYDVTQYTDNGLGQLTRTSYPGNLTRPFLLNGRPAAIEDAPDKTSIMIYEAGAWQRKYELALGYQARGPGTVQNLKILSIGNQIHLFMQLGNTLYHRSHELGTGVGYSNDWEAIGSVGKTWQIAANNTGIYVFSLRSVRNQRQIMAYRYRTNAWEMLTYDRVPFAENIGVCSLPGTDRFILLTQLFPGSLRMFEIEGKNIIKSKSFGREFPFSPAFPLIFIVPYSGMIILPLTLAIIISFMMRKHRLCRYRTESNEMPYASLTRRALAQIIDGLILAGPFVLSFIFMISRFINLENIIRSNFTPLLSIILMFAGFPWMIVWLLIFSATEGSRGVTPGKWLLGIRVMGTDLRPCGFGRAFLRNVLKFVDGFFNFMVGVMVAALSENWQRVGDMAARTVVVDIKSKVSKT